MSTVRCLSQTVDSTRQSAPRCSHQRAFFFRNEIECIYRVTIRCVRWAHITICGSVSHAAKKTTTFRRALRGTLIRNRDAIIRILGGGRREVHNAAVAVGLRHLFCKLAENGDDLTTSTADKQNSLKPLRELLKQRHVHKR